MTKSKHSDQSAQPILIGGKGFRFLVPDKLESRLLGGRFYTKKSSGWVDRAKRHGLFFDLSRVEWVDIGAAVQLVTLIEAGLRDRLNITVALPLPRARQSEDAWMAANPGAAHSTLQRIARRVNALGFLRYLRFDEVLSAEHLIALPGRLTILREYDSSEVSSILETDLDEDPSEEDQEYDPETSPLYRFFFPLTWLSTTAPDQLGSISAFLASVIGARDRGIEPLDADSIKNVILYELVQNVVEHAQGTEWALVAAWARPQDRPPLAWQYFPNERPYLNWFKEKNSPLVEIVVGDSGVGIPHNLGKSYRTASSQNGPLESQAPSESAEILLWAFDRWSTSKDSEGDRGTRGLYRLDRVVKKYQGLITVRSEDQIVGLDHGGPSFDLTFGGYLLDSGDHKM